MTDGKKLYGSWRMNTKVWKISYIRTDLGRKYQVPILSGDEIAHLKVVNDDLLLVLLPNPNTAEPDALRKHDLGMWTDGDVWSLLELHYKPDGFLLDRTHEVSIHYGEENAVKAMEQWQLKST
jgi:hypothetical protein